MWTRLDIVQLIWILENRYNSNILYTLKYSLIQWSFCDKNILKVVAAMWWLMKPVIEQHNGVTSVVLSLKQNSHNSHSGYFFPECGRLKSKFFDIRLSKNSKLWKLFEINFNEKKSLWSFISIIRRNTMLYILIAKTICYTAIVILNHVVLSG